MREIKFRAWDKEKKEMVQVLKMNFMFETIEGIMVEGYDNHTIDHIIMPENLILMQYIGFKDICQGDKCRLTFNEFYSNSHFSIDEGGILVGVVKMVDCMWVVMLDDKCEIPFFDIINGEIDVEVIGNIYEGES